MTTAEKILVFCHTPRTAAAIATHCKVQLSSIYSAIGRMQMKGLVTRIDEDKARATYVLTKPDTIVECENLVIKHAHNPFGLRP